MKLPIKKLSQDAKIPTRGSDGAAGYDLYALNGAVFAGHAIIKTGIAVAIPKGHYGRIAPRSGLAAKYGVDVLGGVIDSDYRVEIGVILKFDRTADADAFIVNPGDRIAQLIIERCYDAELVEFDELPPSERGQGGFGSTGK
jgi:dUTP pyrophosphatase